jgi:hypothetical protein
MTMIASAKTASDQNGYLLLCSCMWCHLDHLGAYCPFVSTEELSIEPESSVKVKLIETLPPLAV